ncbi:MAG: divergent polysaccharide deacetylase family protein [Alphaproteobacteria bacterium]|nr:divergent polysaccharide deacetylase family protein [Alphaproteobacteria bacterium]
MPRDELKQPLRQRRLAQRLWERRPRALTVAYIALIAGFSGGGYWLVQQPHPFAGEPQITLAVPPVEEIKTASIDPAPTPEPPVLEEVATAKPAAKIVEPVQQQNYQQDATIYVSTKQPLTKAPISGATEASAAGPLPRITPQGRKPSDLYARPVPVGLIHSEAPKIVIILGGMGLDEKLTAKAAKNLPGDISFAFAPYGENLQAQVDKARANGHEVLLQVPLEPVGYPATNPGPKTLLADAPEAANAEALQWHMSRFTGYTGVINYMGGRFLSSAPAIKPLLAELRKRGVLFMEDGSLPLSATDGVAKSMQMQVRRADSVVDLDANPISIQAALNLLEEQAKTNGIAIGTGTGLPTTIDAIADWAKSAPDRGVVIMPASAAFKGRLG